MDKNHRYYNNLFAGSATAIMSFHSDVQMAAVFENYYYIFSKKDRNPNNY